MNTVTLNRWHRRIGIVSALVVLMLAVTGLLLNHTESIGLDRHYVRNTSVLNWYNISPPQAPVSFRLDDTWVSRVGDRIYFNDRELEERSEILWGIGRQKDMFVLALEDKLLLLTADGEQVEKLGGYDGVPAGITGIGMNEYDELVIQAHYGDFLVDLNTLAWQDYEELAAEWSHPETTPAELTQQLMQLYRGKGLSWERLLLDLHSGRVLGKAGVYLVDLAALLFIFLALSGSWMWYRRRP